MSARSRHVVKRNGRTVYLCHGCGKPLRMGDLARNSTSHDPCRKEAIRRSEVAEARRHGIPVKELRAQLAARRAA